MEAHEACGAGSKHWETGIAIRLLRVSKGCLFQELEADAKPSE